MDSQLNLLHAVTCPTTDRWRYPFIRKVCEESLYCHVALTFYQVHRDYIAIDCHHTGDPSCYVYKLGGPAPIRLLEVKKHSMHLSRGLVDNHGLVIADVSRKKKEFQMCISFYPLDGGKKSTVVCDTYPCEIDRKCATLLYGSGLVVYFLSNMNASGVNVKTKVSILRFQSSNKLKRKPFLTLKSSGPVPAESGSEILQKELVDLSNDMGVDDLMELVAYAKQRLREKRDTTNAE